MTVSDGRPPDRRATELTRIQREYDRRERELGPGMYSMAHRVNRFMHAQWMRVVADALAADRRLPLTGQRVLEVGCGGGGWLPECLVLGAAVGDCAGIDLLEARVANARVRLGPSADLRVGDASALPWADGVFDVVLQGTVFSSILDAGLRAAVAAEMLRVVRPDGVIVWYDLWRSNPANPGVRGLPPPDIRALFPGCRVQIQRVTLAPPVARMVASWAWSVAAGLERLRWLNTHALALIHRT